MNYSTSGFLILNYFLEFAQTHFHCVNGVSQLAHPLLLLCLPAFNLSQHQGLFQWVSSHINWPKYWSFSFSISLSNEYSMLISFVIDWFDLLAVQGGLTRVFFSTTIQKHEFFSAQPSLWSSSSIHDYWKKHGFEYGPLLAKWCLCFLTTFLGLS